MRRKTDLFASTRRLAASAVLVGGALVVICPAAEGLEGFSSRQKKATQGARRSLEKMDDARRKEGEALISLADGAMAGRAAASDFAIEWRNDFLKAEPGTFVPFIVTLNPAAFSAASVLMYVRAARRDQAAGTAGSAPAAGYPFEDVFPVELGGPQDAPVRISRGFAVPAGDYDIYVAVRERPADPVALEQPRLRSAVLKQPITVPDFWTGELTTSTVMVADRIENVPPTAAPTTMFERPYVLGDRDVHPAASASFRRDQELLVVFLIYNPTVSENRHFDIQVDYHLYMRTSDATPVGTGGATDDAPARPGERYVTRTSPQRFNLSTQGTSASPAAGDPVMAGQGILLSSFQEGEYRLGITVTDLLSRKTLSRDVTFTVVGS